MDSVSDVLAFVASQPDYWTDLLTEVELPKELSPEEREGLIAAREHIDLAVVALLRLCASAFYEALGEERARKKSFYEGTTAKNRRVDLNPPKDTEAKLYRLEFELWGETATGQPVCIWASLVAKKKYSPQIQAELVKAKVEHSTSDYHISATPVQLTEGRSFSELAKEAAEKMIALVLAVYEAKAP
jgi:hypothetical protein